LKIKVFINLPMLRISLLQFENDFISVDIQAYFREESLVVKGYDIGKGVKEILGDSDYEYTNTVPEKEVHKLYPILEVTEGDKMGLLRAVAARFNSNKCYSEFGDFLKKNNIDCNGFSWI
jgi:hypothetical protein